jgi:uncharacterized phage-associated protein
MPTATQVAKWIIQYRQESGVPVDPVTLQKLLYYAQAFCLARHGEPLFRERFKAWVHGPVIPQIWHSFNANERGVLLLQDGEPQSQIDSEFEQCVRDSVVFFSRISPFILSDATHNEDPWRNARGDKTSNEHSDEAISEEAIRIYYSGLISDGEDALSKHEALSLVPEPRIGVFYQAGICVRKMKAHPLYRMQLAEALLTPVPPDPELPKDIYAPINRREFVAMDEL